MARDTYFADTDNSAKLMAYQADDQINIRLVWGVLQIYQRLVSDEETPPTYTWTDNGGTEPTAAAVTTLNATVTQHGMDIATNTGNITSLTTTVGNKADSSALTTLSNTVTTQGMSITTNAGNITTLQTAIGNKADTTALTALTNRVTATETNIMVEQANVDRLEASLDGVTLGPTQNTFDAANESAAELARDTYAADSDNADWLAQYNGNIALHIRLRYGTTTVYQRRNAAGTRWRNTTANPRASSSALTALTNTVATNTGNITTNAGNITTLTSTVADKADTSAVTALTTRVSTAETSITTIQGNITNLQSGLNGKANTTALTALTNRVTENEGEIETNQSNVAVLEASFDGITLGPLQNTFTGADRAAAEMARDTFFSSNSDELREYNEDASLHIRLRFGTTTVYQHRESDAWANVAADPRVATSAITTLTNRVTVNETGISTNSSNITSLTNTVGNKADTSALTALSNRVTTTENDIDDAETNIEALQTSVTNLTTSVGTKADTTALTALTNRVTVNEGTITTNQSNVALLEAALDGLALGPPQNTFTGDNLAAAQSARDTYFTANTDNLTAYNDDDTLHIRLIHGTTTVYQHRDGGAWADVAANPRASTSALTALTSTVATNTSSITAIQGTITTLTSTVNSKADATALAAKADTTALTALTNRVTATETSIDVNQDQVSRLEATLDGLTLGPAEHTFTGANRAAAETARDTYFTANAAKLTEYNDDRDLYIRLRWGTNTQYQRRNNAGTRWNNVNADPRAATSAVTNLGTRVAATESSISANSRDITALEARISSQNLGPETNEFTGATRADAETARDTYFTTNPTKLAQYDADSTLNIRLLWNSGALRVFQNRESSMWEDNGEVEATAAAVTTLSATVTQNTMDISTNTASITSLTTSLAGKADSSALTALEASINENADGIDTNATAITALQVSTSEFTLGMEQNEFTGADRAAAETARDTYQAGNAAWWQDYADNPKNYIVLQFD